MRGETCARRTKTMRVAFPANMVKGPFLDQEVCRRIIYHRRAYQAAQYACSHLSSPLDLGGIAAVVTMERCSFSRYFRQKTGITFGSFVRAARVAAAVARLECSDDSLSSIARDCGFGNLTTLTRSFKAVTRMTPTEYRRRCLRPDLAG